MYKNLLSKKNRELQEKINRLESGLVKLQSCARQVDDLKDKLAAQEIELKQKNDDADKLIKVCSIIFIQKKENLFSVQYRLSLRKRKK